MRIDETERATVDVPEAARMLGLSRWSGYERARTGWLTAGVPVLRCGRRLVVSREALRAALAFRDDAAS